MRLHQHVNKETLKPKVYIHSKLRVSLNICGKESYKQTYGRVDHVSQEIKKIGDKR